MLLAPFGCISRGTSSGCHQAAGALCCIFSCTNPSCSPVQPRVGRAAQPAARLRQSMTHSFPISMHLLSPCPPQARVGRGTQPAALCLARVRCSVGGRLLARERARGLQAQVGSIFPRSCFGRFLWGPELGVSVFLRNCLNRFASICAARSAICSALRSGLERCMPVSVSP